MEQRRRFAMAWAATVAVLAASAAPGWTDQSGQGDREAANAGSMGPDDVAVTLITGDRVVLRNGDVDRAEVDPGAGRGHVNFAIDQVDGQLTVLPSDAVALVARELLDPRLFDVSGLLEIGYDDAEQAEIPLILDLGTDSAGSQRSGVDQPGTSDVRLLPAVNGAAVKVAKAAAVDFWSEVSGDAPSATQFNTVERIWLDGLRQPVLDQSVHQIGAPAAWDAGVDGDGVTVAVIDSGIDPNHPDLSDRVVARQNFVEFGQDDDVDGHGTHVASIIAGSGAAADSQYRGVAHGADLVDAKVCESNFCLDSDIINGLHWATTEKGADVVNISLGGEDTAAIDPLEEAINVLTEQTGALFVVAAGNDREYSLPVGSPASAEAALAVGAVDRDGDIAEFSSAGPRVGDGGLKPEVTAPGVGIVAARSANGWMGDPVSDFYTTLSGTSMSAPHVAGAAALLAQANPSWTGEQLKAALMSGAEPNPDLTVDDQGAGLVNIAATLDLAVLSEPASLNLGRQLWPHDDDELIERTFTYSNVTDQQITLTLDVTSEGPDGRPAPEGMFTVADTELEVPAGGSATATLTADTAVGGIDGRYTGRVEASGGGPTTVTTLFAIDQEVESYDVTFAHTGRDGDPAVNYVTKVHSHDARLSELRFGFDEGDTFRLRLPAGRYNVVSDLQSGEFSPKGCLADDCVDGHQSLLSYPLLEVDSEMTIDLDARKALPLDVELPNDEASFDVGEFGYELQLDSESRSFRVERLMLPPLYLPETTFTGHLGPVIEPAQMESWFVGSWADLWSDDDPTVYALSWFDGGKLLEGVTSPVSADDLAAVRHDIRGVADEQVAYGEFQVAGPAGLAETYVRVPEIPVPTVLTTYLTADEGVRWAPEIGLFPFGHYLWSPPRAYEPGHSYAETWNSAVFSPGFPESGLYSGGPPAIRTGDVMSFDMSMLSDGAGHGGTTGEGSAHTALYADGKLLDEQDWIPYGEFEVPGGSAEYRLEASISRGQGEAHLSTDVTAEWTFESATTDNPAALPLSAVRFAPMLDSRNRTSKPVALIPVTIEAMPGAPKVPPRGLSAEVSFDDGGSWKPVLAVGGRDGFWWAIVRHEPGAEFVSLRARAEDREGNTVEQTTIRAYELK